MYRGAALALVLALVPGCDDWPLGDDDRQGINVMWSRPISDGEAVPLTYPAVSSELVVFAVLGGQARALSITRGAPEWEAAIGRPIPRNLEFFDGLFYGVAGSTAHALGSNGSPAWTEALAADGSYGRSAVDGDRLYVAEYGGIVNALSRVDGHSEWRTNVAIDSAPISLVHGITVSGERVYVGVEGYYPLGVRRGLLVALSSSTGDEIWRYPVPEGHLGRSTIIDAPLVFEGLVIGSDIHSNAVIAVDAGDGEFRWRWQGPHGWVGPLSSPVGESGTVYFGSGDTHVYALSADSGAELWSRRLESSVGQVAICDENLVVSRIVLEVLDKESGRSKAVLFDGLDQYVVGGVVVRGSTAFLATNDALVAIDCS